jgi:Flp pilus assembly protein TadG
MSMFRNVFARRDESSAAVVKFGLFALVLLVIVVGATAFTTYEAVHDNYAVEA